MRSRTVSISFLFVALAALVPAMTGCNLDGWELDSYEATAGDDQPDDGGDDGSGGGGGGSTTTQFKGTWVTSYSDDLATSNTSAGQNQYAARMVLNQSGSEITGTGRAFRVFRSGATASDTVDFNISGTVSGDEAILVWTAKGSRRFDGAPGWRVRVASSRLVGFYIEQTSGGQLIRSGHAYWYKASTASINDAWAGAFGDEFAVEGESMRDRTGVVTLSTTAESTLQGAGSYVEIRPADSSLTLEYNVVRGAIDGSQMGFTFGEADLGANEIDWFGFFSGSAICAAYGQFDTTDRIARFGHTTWFRATPAGPSAITHNWVSAFGDARTAEGVDATDYITILSLTAQDGGGVTGTAKVLDQAEDDPQYKNYTVRNGTILGSQAHIELEGSDGTFFWDFRVAGSTMPGSYQFLDGSGNFVAGGSAEFRFLTSASTVGSWVAAYVDTLGVTTQPDSQFTVVSISNQANDGAIIGTGALRIAGEANRRLFNVIGKADNGEITWIWRGTELFGDIVWNLRQSGGVLHGTYSNFNSAGNLETQGYAVFIRASSTAESTTE